MKTVGARNMNTHTEAGGEAPGFRDMSSPLVVQVRLPHDLRECALHRNTK